MHDLTGFRTSPVVDPATRGSRHVKDYTTAVIGQTGPNANPRIAELFASFIRHIHSFVRENKITTIELATAMSFIAQAAKDGQLMLLVGPFGFAGICEETTWNMDSLKTENRPTSYTGIGPYYRAGAPLRQPGASVVDAGFPDADRILMFGRVIDFETGNPLANAELDLWQAGTNGFYDHEDPEQPTWNLRGRFKTASDGTYSLICLRPTPYPIPTKGAAADFLRLLDRHPMRPGHIHFKIAADKYLPLVTELYEKDDKYLNSDVVFDVHDSVVIQVEAAPGEESQGYGFKLNFDFKLISNTFAEENNMKAAEDWIHAVLNPY